MHIVRRLVIMFCIVRRHVKSSSFVVVVVIVARGWYPEIKWEIVVCKVGLGKLSCCFSPSLFQID